MILSDVVAELVLQLPSERIEFIAAKVESMKVLKTQMLCELFGPNASQCLVHDFLDAVVNAEWCTGRALAAMLQAALKSAEKRNRVNGSVELIWTGPATPLVPMRRTEAALCEVINAACDEIFIVSFVAYNIPAVSEALANAVSRGVKLNFLLEPSTGSGGHVAVDSITHLKAKFPQAAFYTWAENSSGGSIHAKCAVADSTVAFITSANLTGMAMDANMELGVLVKGGSLPRQLSEHIKALGATKIIIM